MKLLHLSDLHLGKRVNEFSMLEDQKYILNQILQIVINEQVNTVLIAGDVYDKSVPSAQAVTLFDDFLTRLEALECTVLLIAGNHDSPERLAFGAHLLQKSRVYLSPVFDGRLTCCTLNDEYGELDVWLMPFLKPSAVRPFYPEDTMESYQDAAAVVLRSNPPHQGRRSILVAHQFVTGAKTGGSEELSVGGAENIDAALFAAYDYVALGHIHSPQRVGRETVRYCGSPLKYSLSEARGTKSVTLITFNQPGEIDIKLCPLTPLHDLRTIRGTYDEVTARTFYEGTATDDYLHITLTDETEVLDAVGKLRSIYPNVMRVDYDNTRTRAGASMPEAAVQDEATPMELFCRFFEWQNEKPLTERQRALLEKEIEAVWEER
ncbi:MAG TPA: exonuclease SbcCD subunit D [Candidatus Ruthenibacterium avium]|uniref:Nuclease SbcCD subunit D n=1 Tax=Candidatus Ruthenibacterium avium TaxID=2838751 RepID=A0A9D2M1C5_9FIRM|nr:exonuclease SbcCD subunit D [Candidatus Ruthenibacterium avium]